MCPPRTTKKTVQTETEPCPPDALVAQNQPYGPDRITQDVHAGASGLQHGIDEGSLEIWDF